MRKNRTKHEAKKPRLAKRALALCFALIFVCSCLLPVFAHSEENLLMQETVVEEQQDEQPMLNEGGTDSTEGGTNPTGDNEDSTGSGTNPTEETKPAEQSKPEGTTEEPKVEEQPKTEETKPEETKPEGTTEESKGTTEETKTEGTTEESKDTAEETKPEEPKQPTTNTTGDTIEQDKATYTYRFWPDKIDAFELEAINDDVKAGTSLNDAAQLRVKMVPCTVLTVMTNAYLGDYQANVQQPTKPGYEFAGWYTVEGTTEDEFSFEQSLNFEESQTIDVFAKWEKLVTLQTTVTVDVDATLFGGEAAISLADEYSYEDDRMAAPTKTLTLDVEATNLSSNSELFVSSTSSSAIDTYCENNDLMPILTLDITPKDKDSGKKTEPQETSIVTISGLSELELPNELTMVHKKDDGTIETIKAEYSNGTLTFEAPSFSTYAVAVAGRDRKPATSNQPVYVYLRIDGNTEGLVNHRNGWFLIGRIPSVELPSLSKQNVGRYVNYLGSNNDYQQAVVDKAKAADGIERNGNGAIADDGGSFLTNEDAKAAIKANKNIELTNVKWDGLKAASGADGFANGGTLTWHLDGTLKREFIDSYTIKYIDKDTNKEIQAPHEANAMVGTEIDISSNETLKPSTITTTDGKTYQLDHGSPADYRITVEKDGHAHGRNVINLYYRDTSVSYPLFVYARISDTIYKELRDNLKLNANQWYTLGVVDKSGLEKPAGGVTDQDKKVRTGTNYTTAYNSLENIKRYKDNQEIDLNWVEFDYDKLVDGVSFGLTKANGADGYADTSGNSYTNKDGIKTTVDTLSWHLDGYIPSIGAVVINYYIKGTTTPLKEAVIHYGRTGSSHTLTDGEKLPELSKNGLTYTLDESSITPTGGTQAFVDDEVNTINLYYDREVNLLNIPDSYESFIVVEKRFSGLTENTIPKDFKITVGSTEYGLDSGNGVQIGNDYVVRWKITGVNAGSYTIKESGYEKPGYKTEAKVTGSTATFDPATGTTVTVVVPTLSSFHATVTTPKKNASYDVKMEGTTNTIFVGRLTGKVGNGLIVFTKEPLSYAQREAIKNVLKTYPMENGGTWGKNNTEVHFYSVDEQLKNGGFNIDGSYVTYSSNGKITFSDQGIWSMVATATYSTTEAQNPEVSITNTYTLNTTNVTITKKTTGAFADRAKAFKFTVSGLNTDATLEGTNVTRDSFTLSNGESVTIKNLEVGQTITITENATDSKDYDTTADGHAKVNAGHAKSFQYRVCFDETSGEIYLQALDANGNAITDKTITGENLSITVTNNFDGNPDTGVLLDTLPYLILLAVAVAGGVLVVVRKRKHRDE